MLVLIVLFLVWLVICTMHSSSSFFCASFLCECVFLFFLLFRLCAVALFHSSIHGSTPCIEIYRMYFKQKQKHAHKAFTFPMFSFHFFSQSLPFAAYVCLRLTHDVALRERVCFMNRNLCNSVGTFFFFFSSLHTHSVLDKVSNETEFYALHICRVCFGCIASATVRRHTSRERLTEIRQCSV